LIAIVKEVHLFCRVAEVFKGLKAVQQRKEQTMTNTPPKVYPSILQAIGNTPVVKLRKLPSEGSASVLVKLEYYNPTGSYKDRMALAMIEEAEARGALRPGMTVVEYTGGSTGSSLAFICAMKGYPFRVVSSDAFAREKLQTMRAFGAELTIVPSQEGQITLDLLPRMIEEARRIVSAEKDTYWTNQMYNTDSIKGYWHWLYTSAVEKGCLR
jgi:cysteine synthase A